MAKSENEKSSEPGYQYAIPSVPGPQDHTEQPNHEYAIPSMPDPCDYAVPVPAARPGYENIIPMTQCAAYAAHCNQGSSNL